VPSPTQQLLSKLKFSKQANGFILLEVLVAMGLIASGWMALSNTYQGMILRLGQVAERGVALRKAMDQHELAILNAAQLSNSNQESRKLVDESSGMSRRARPVPGLSRTTHKK
jgi:type II secretory pathway pseudopilin PulG